MESGSKPFDEDDSLGVDLAAHLERVQEREQLRRRMLEVRRRKQLAWSAAALAAALVVGALAFVGQRKSSQAGLSTKTPISSIRGQNARRVSQAAARAGRHESTASVAGGATAEISIVVAGDMIFDRRVKQMMQSEGPDAPLAGVAPLLRNADVALANLESPLSERGTPWAGKDVTFAGDPAAARAIKRAGIDAVSLANNHALDYGYDALADTIDRLDKVGLEHAGAGRNWTEALRPGWIHSGGRKIAFLAFTWIVPGGFSASANRPGVAGTRDPAVVSSAVRRVADRADFTVVSFHWGMEYQDSPVQDQVALAHAAIDAGASLVMGHHPHVIQGIELYRGRPIVYSLGDFVFDHYSRKTGEAYLLKVRLMRRRLIGARVTPVYLSWDGRPQPVSGSDGASILDRLQELSSGYGTKLQGRSGHASIRAD